MSIAKREQEKLLGVQLWVWEGASYIVTVLGVLAGLFAVYQYYDATEAQRSKETLAMIEIWETRAYAEAFDRLRERVIEFSASIPEAELALARKNVQAAENLRHSMYDHVLSGIGGQTDLDKVVYFFNRLGLCVKASLCSFKTSYIFFKDPLEGFMSNFASFIKAKQIQLPGYANGLILLEEEFSKN
ncbi:hypothetical protein [Roseibium sp.]|uniref:hypothetical protein n=1 Tax=Roseibium sp. TaxID=1936156 RepID=UPI003A969510